MFASLCAFAESNRDGTFTLVRSGITYWEAPLPLDVRLHLFLEIPPGTFERGPVDLRLDFEDPNRVSIGGATGTVEIQAPELPLRLVLPVEARVAAYGPCKIVGSVGEVPFAMDLLVKPVPAEA